MLAFRNDAWRPSYTELSLANSQSSLGRSQSERPDLSSASTEDQGDAIEAGLQRRKIVPGSFAVSDKEPVMMVVGPRSLFIFTAFGAAPEPDHRWRE
jgi:hypothetical protein